MRVLIVMLCVTACTPDIPEGRYGCSDDSECPEDWFCHADDRCWSTPQSTTDAGQDAPSDAQDVDVEPDSPDGCSAAPADVDLLVMIDNSGSMREEQIALASAFPALIDGLVTGDITGDGIGDFRSVDTLHIGVISSDIGVDRTVSTCATAFGDDGILIATSPETSCPMTTHVPAYLSFMPGESEQLKDDLSCLARLGTFGCGFEQQLEAVLKALTPSTSVVRFHGASFGHGDTENAGFLRDNSLLVVLILTDEEDCSAANYDLFDPSSAEFGDNENLRCARFPGELHPTSRYVDGLLALRSDPRQLVFAPLIGLPTALQGMPLANMLSDERMQYVEMERPSALDTLRPSCTNGTMTSAQPGRRYVEVAQGLQAAGAQVMVRSICEPSFDSTVTALLETMAPSLAARCL